MKNDPAVSRSIFMVAFIGNLRFIGVADELCVVADNGGAQS